MAFDTTDVFASDPGDPQGGSEASQGTSPDTQAEAPSGMPGMPGRSQQASESWDIPGVGQVSRDELIKGYLRQQDYTRKTMALSQRDREYQQAQQQAAAMEATLAQVREFLQDRNRLSAYLQQLGGGQPELAPDQILTAAEAQALMQQRFGEADQTFNQRLAQSEQRILQGVYQTQYEQSIDGKLRSIGTQFPELTRIPGMELLLREAVKSQKPQTIEDVLVLFDQAASYYATQLRGMAKQQLVQPNNPLTRGMEPPSNGAPLPDSDPTDFTGVKDPRLRDLVIKDLMAMTSRG